MYTLWVDIATKKEKIISQVFNILSHLDGVGGWKMVNVNAH